jgi:tripartite-type tricarboxylate transporter receptor subunit TctC
LEAHRGPRRRAFVAAGALAAAGYAARGFAQGFATTRILVGYAPGGNVDLLGRLYAERLRDALGAPVVVENRVGAGGRIAAQALKHAAADGATLMLAPIVVPVFAPLIYRDLPFDPARDFASVALVGHYQLGLAVGASHTRPGRWPHSPPGRGRIPRRRASVRPARAGWPTSSA